MIPPVLCSGAWDQPSRLVGVVKVAKLGKGRFGGLARPGTRYQLQPQRKTGTAAYRREDRSLPEQADLLIAQDTGSDALLAPLFETGARVGSDNLVVQGEAENGRDQGL